MAKTFFFYDLETSGLNSRYQRIMQFGGQRTDLDLSPIGEPVNVLIRLSDDILPDPGAIVVTGITPQKTVEEGIAEPDFAKLFIEHIATPDTMLLGFNNIRFDDEFIRHTLWRNFYDPYEWAWSEGRSRWDMLDVVRMTRALRPDGIKWPVDKDGAPTNRLELLTKINGLEHDNAHDALSDVIGTIDIARLIKQKQPKLFDYLLTNCGKKEIAALVNLEDPKPFVYSSGRYGKDNLFTTVAFPIAPGTRPGSVIVYDLRRDPKNFEKLSIKEIGSRLFASREQRHAEDFVAIPVKELAYNKCPAVAPLGVLDEAAKERLGIDRQTIETNLKALSQDFASKVAAAYGERDAFPQSSDVEGQLYDGFMDDKDKNRLAVVRAASEKDLADFHPEFIDERLPELLLRYKARWFPRSLSEDEQVKWDEYVKNKFAVTSGQFAKNLQIISKQYEGNDTVQFLVEELRLWYEAHAPVD